MKAFFKPIPKAAGAKPAPPPPPPKVAAPRKSRAKAPKTPVIAPIDEDEAEEVKPKANTATRKRTRGTPEKPVVDDDDEAEAEAEEEAEPSPPASKARSGGLSSYEEERLANIKRNEEFLASLGFSQVKASIQPVALPKAPPRRKTAPMKRYIIDNTYILYIYTILYTLYTYTLSIYSIYSIYTDVCHTSYREEAVPTRRSGRVTVEKLQEELLKMEEGGESAEKQEEKQKELDGMLAKREAPYVVEAMYGGHEREGRIPPEPIPFTELDYDMEKLSDAPKVLDQLDIFVKDMRDMGDVKDVKGGSARKVKSSPAPMKKSSTSSTSVDDCRKTMASLSCDETDIAKLTAHRVACTYIHPSESKLLIAAGDKTGNLGLWDVNKASSSEVQSVYKYKPHAGSLCQIVSSPATPGSMYTLSYDGTIRYLDFEKDR
jgi:hypothetical protein